jgi:cytochrome c556
MVSRIERLALDEPWRRAPYRPSRLFAALVVAAAIAACGPPKMSTPVEEIPKLGSLTEVMRNQATTADPQFEKMDAKSFSDADYAAFATTAQRIEATSLKIKDFSKGPEFDALAMRLNEKAKALGVAANAKDAAASSTALHEMKATCKECHSKFR